MYSTYTTAFAKSVNKQEEVRLVLVVEHHVFFIELKLFTSHHKKIRTLDGDEQANNFIFTLSQTRTP